MINQNIVFEMKHLSHYLNLYFYIEYVKTNSLPSLFGQQIILSYLHKSNDLLQIYQTAFCLTSKIVHWIIFRQD